jgi:ribonuclease HI
MATVEAYIDGSCRGNPGPGGYGAVFIFDPEKGEKATKIHEIGGFSAQTTNNQMELQAVIAAIEEIGPYLAKNKDNSLILHSDSSYVVVGVNSWLAGWKQKGWKTASKSPVLNREYWMHIDELMAQHRGQITVSKVAGHAGVLHNERADVIATMSADKEEVELSKVKF